MSEPTKLDPVLTATARILILHALRPHFDGMQPVAIEKATGLSSGNVSSHLKKLEDAMYVVRKDAIINLRPGTLVQLTSRGNEALLRHEAHLEALDKSSSNESH